MNGLDDRLMGGFRIILSKSLGNRFLHSSLYVVVNFVSQYRFRGRRLGALALSNESGI
jgi:hypothetical protein